MLFQMLDALYARINKMEVDKEAPRFADQLQKMRPTLKAELQAKGIAADQLEKSILMLSAAQLVIIKGIPAIAAEMVKILQAGGAEPAFRCVIAASLAYLVQPKDLLPDDLPGGYGFIDDALLLHEACALSWEITGDVARAEEKRKIFQYIFMSVPDGSREQFQSAISGLAITLNIMRSLDPTLAEMTTQMLIANPLQPIAPQGQAGAVGGPSAYGSQFASYPSTIGPQYSWKDGNTMAVNFPGGGGVATDGRDIFIL
jgi:uncharacterized membrane protein YkvA (DUF1232 family)